MPKTLIKLTPTEPYFFGGERIFEIGDGNRHYFIRSLDTPAQTMLFGVLRYLAIEKPRSNADFKTRYDDYKKSRANGEFKREFHGFALNRPDITFGDIRSISPLYLVDKDDCFYIPVPLDHQASDKKYTRFELSKGTVMTNNGPRRLPLDYNAKTGLAEGWLNLHNKSVHTDLFTSIAQIGIDKIAEKQGFFKKEYKRLRDGLAFAFFADIGMELHQKTVFMGQGKSAFGVALERREEPVIPGDLLSPGIVCAQSDIYYTGDAAALYATCQFAAVKTRDHRIFQINNLDRTSSKPIQLIQAGSVFLPNDIETFKASIRNDHAAIAGFNQIIIGGNTL